MNVFKNTVLIIVISALIFEFISYIASRNKLLIFNNTPPYEVAFNGSVWRNEKNIWGAWHKNNIADKHVTSCFKVDYRSNNVGARDDVDYDDGIDPESVAVIGDSFVEGYGVRLSDTFSKNLHRYYGRPGLNFGASGNFGPVQQYYLYNNLIKNIPHKEVILFALPQNDFTDNSDRHMSRYGRRYRPYFKKIDDDKYDIVYPRDAKPNSEFPSDKTKLRNELVDYIFTVLNGYTYSSNALRSLIYAYRMRGRQKGDEDFELHRRGYFIDNEYDVNGSLYFIRRLMESVPAGVKKHIVIVPIEKDFHNIGKHGFSYKKLPWYVGLREIATQHEVNLVDLAESYLAGRTTKLGEKDTSEWYLSCDPHWSAKGHLLALKLFVAKAKTKAN